MRFKSSYSGFYLVENMRGWGDSPCWNKIGKKNSQIFWSPSNSQVPPYFGKKMKANGRDTRCFDQKVIFFCWSTQIYSYKLWKWRSKVYIFSNSFVRTEELCPKQMHLYRIFDNSKSVKFIYIDDICATWKVKTITEIWLRLKKICFDVFKCK